MDLCIVVFHRKKKPPFKCSVVEKGIKQYNICVLKDTLHSNHSIQREKLHMVTERKCNIEMPHSILRINKLALICKLMNVSHTSDGPKGRGV